MDPETLEHLWLALCLSVFWGVVMLVLMVVQ